MSSPITVKQLEAFYWIAMLGTFERAALKLNATQSAISKRIQELERITGITLFDRSQRGARLTALGEDLIAIVEEVLALNENIMSLQNSSRRPARKLRIGVTELTAMTWLSRLIARIREIYPSILLEPEIDMSRSLYGRLMEEEIDLIIIPDVFTDPNVTAVPIGKVENAWLCRPDLVGTGSLISLQQLAQYPVLTHGDQSGSGLYFKKWLKSEGVSFRMIFSSDSISALLGLTLGGMGVSHLPLQCFGFLIDEGKLSVISTTPPLPLVPYAAMYRNDRPQAMTSAIAEVASEVCDFSRQYQV